MCTDNPVRLYDGHMRDCVMAHIRALELKAGTKKPPVFTLAAEQVAIQKRLPRTQSANHCAGSSQ